MAKLFKVALVQASYPGSTAAAIDKSHTLGAEATEKGADLALFQELWTTGYEFFDPAVPSGHAQCLPSSVVGRNHPGNPRPEAARFGLVGAIGRRRFVDVRSDGSAMWR